MTKKELEKPFYLIAQYWLGNLEGFIKIGDNKEEIIKLYLTFPHFFPAWRRMPLCKNSSQTAGRMQDKQNSLNKSS